EWTSTAPPSACRARLTKSSGRPPRSWTSATVTGGSRSDDDTAGWLDRLHLQLLRSTSGDCRRVRRVGAEGARLRVTEVARRGKHVRSASGRLCTRCRSRTYRIVPGVVGFAGAGAG